MNAAIEAALSGTKSSSEPIRYVQLVQDRAGAILSLSVHLDDDEPDLVLWHYLGTQEEPDGLTAGEAVARLDALGIVLTGAWMADDYDFASRSLYAKVALA